MSHESVKAVFSDSVNHIASNISLYVVDPGKDLTRNRKMGAANLISFMVSCGSSSTRLELLQSLEAEIGMVDQRVDVLDMILCNLLIFII